MKTTTQVVALLAVAAVATASEYLCTFNGGTINCSGRDITQPPAGYWPNVGSITLTDTKISAFYKNSFSGYPYLHVLYMHNTPLTKLDMEVFVGANENLQVLQFHNSRIEAVVPAPRGVRFDNLLYVFLNNNTVSSLDPDSFVEAAQLTYVFLNDNPVVVPEGQPILNSESLKILHMQYGSTLGNLGPSSFLGLPNVEEVVLLSAKITSIHGAFLTNSKLRTLALGGNSIAELTSGTFAPTNTLSELYLNNNPLELLETEALEGALTKGANVDISDTPLACSCGYQAFYEWAQTQEITVQATCNGSNACRFETH